MSEINEKDLEQVAGGAAGEAFEKTTWFRDNCMRCAKYKSCPKKVRVEAANKAEKAAERGEEYRCPYMR